MKDLYRLSSLQFNLDSSQNFSLSFYSRLREQLMNPLWDRLHGDPNLICDQLWSDFEWVNEMRHKAGLLGLPADFRQTFILEKLVDSEIRLKMPFKVSRSLGERLYETFWDSLEILLFDPVYVLLEQLDEELGC